jgi:glycosyltransferase involved in cell wall biosynthesis
MKKQYPAPLKAEGGLRTKGIIKENFPGNPLVSIITVTYNRARYLEQAMLSVLEQTYKNIEYIIIDGGSNDGTVDIINNYNNQLDYWLSEKDDGMYYALNKGIEFAKGEFIGICHSDDYYYNRFVIEHFISFQRSTVADIYHGDIMTLAPNNQFSERIISSSQIIERTNNSINHPTTFIRKELFHRFGSYDTSYRSASDYEMMMRLKINKCEFKYLGIIVSIMRVGSEKRVSNNCYSILENYRIHNKYKTGNKNKYLSQYIYCSLNHFAKYLGTPNYKIVNQIRNVLRKLLVKL